MLTLNRGFFDMGKLDLRNVRQVPEYASTPISGAELRIYNISSDVLSVVYRDPDLTHTRANPLKANTQGHFPICYLIDGEYRLEIERCRPRGALCACADSQWIAIAA